MGANQSPQSDSSFSFDNDNNGNLAAEDMQEIVRSYLAQISGCLKSKKTADGLAAATDERDASSIQSRQESMQNRLETDGHEPISGEGLPNQQQTIMHPLGDGTGSPSGAVCCQTLPAGKLQHSCFSLQYCYYPESKLPLNFFLLPFGVTRGRYGH